MTGETDGNLVSCNGVSANCSGISKGGYDYYISKYNSTGNWKWTKQLGKKYGETYSNGIAINKFGEINIVGTTEVDLKSCNGVLDQCTNFVPGAQNFILKYRPQ